MDAPRLTYSDAPTGATFERSELTMQDHVKRLSERIEYLQRELEATAKEAAYPDLLTIIRRPGFTTPAELALLLGLVDNLTAQVTAIRQANGSLLAGAREVGAAARA
jgi:hypothetical protein